MTNVRISWQDIQEGRHEEYLQITTHIASLDLKQIWDLHICPALPQLDKFENLTEQQRNQLKNAHAMYNGARDNGVGNFFIPDLLTSDAWDGDDVPEVITVWVSRETIGGTFHRMVLEVTVKEGTV